MRLPNGFGSVHKLPGKRRKPFRARKTAGWMYVDKDTEEEVEITEDTVLSSVKAIQKYVTIGYYSTKKEALAALLEYNEDPYDLHLNTITFAEVYERWSDVHYEKVKDARGYKAAYKNCVPLYNMPFNSIKLDHLQKVVDDSGKNSPTLKNMKILFGQMWDYGVMHEICTPDRREMVRYVDISKPGNPRAYDRKPFTKKAIKQLWDAAPSNAYISVVLMLIYTGVRIISVLCVYYNCRYAPSQNFAQ